MFQKEYLLIDGYNIINAWDFFSELKTSDLAHARDLLAEIVANYAGFKQLVAVIVFDAYATNDPESIEQKYGIDVVYTAKGETADSYIEKLAYKLIKNNHDVFVVTSDHSEQLAILGMGAYRISSREFIEKCSTASKNIKIEINRKKDFFSRNEVGTRLNNNIILKLESLRKLNK